MGFSLLLDPGTPWARWCTLNHVIWADDLWLIARSYIEIEFLLEAIDEGMAEAGLQLKRDDKLRISANVHCHEQGPLEGPAGLVVEPSDVVDCLGHEIDIDGVPQAPVEFRCLQTRRHLNARVP